MDNVHCTIDFDTRIGEFASNDGETKIDLPANQYLCYMDEFKWYMDKEEMEMASNREPLNDFVIDTDDAVSTSNSTHAVGSGRQISSRRRPSMTFRRR